MFICQVTGRHSKLGEKMNRIPVVKRDKIYFKKIKNEDTGKWDDVEVGRGWEIVKEISATDEGVVAWNNMSETQKQNLLKKL